MTTPNGLRLSFDGMEKNDGSWRLNFTDQKGVRCRYRGITLVLLGTVAGRRRAAQSICMHGHKRGWTAQAAVNGVPR